MRTNSLAVRLFLWATAWTVVILIITGVALSTLYRHAVERAFDRRLDVYLRTLVADVASPEDSGDKFPQSIGEPLFELPLSGWYWQVTRLDSKTPEMHSSRSLWDSNLPRLAAGRAQYRSRSRRPLLCCRSRRRLGNRRGNAQFQPRHRHHLHRAHDGAVVDHCFAGTVRSGSLNAHFRESRRDPVRPRGTVGRRISGRDCSVGTSNQCADRGQSGDRRARA